MIHEFTEDNILSIGKVLESTPKKLGNDVYRLEMDDQENGRKLALEIHLGLEVNEKRYPFIPGTHFFNFTTARLLLPVKC